MKDTVMYQYNKIEIILDNNGKKYSSKRTNHINISFLHHQPHQARWTLSKLLSHWRHFHKLFPQVHYINIGCQVPQVHHEHQGLIILIGHRSLFVYNVYLVYSYSVKLLSKQLQHSIFAQHSILVQHPITFYSSTNIIYILLLLNTYTGIVMYI